MEDVAIVINPLLALTTVPMSTYATASIHYGSRECLLFISN